MWISDLSGHKITVRRASERYEEGGSMIRSSVVASRRGGTGRDGEYYRDRGLGRQRRSRATLARMDDIRRLRDRLEAGIRDLVPGPG